MVLEMTPGRAIEQLEREFGLSAADLAGALGVNPRTLERWRTGESYPQHEARRRLVALLGLHRHLAETFTTPDAIRAWLHETNRYIGGLTPADALRVGRVDRAEAALEALDLGVFL